MFRRAPSSINAIFKPNVKTMIQQIRTCDTRANKIFFERSKVPVHERIMIVQCDILQRCNSSDDMKILTSHKLTIDPFVDPKAALANLEVVRTHLLEFQAMLDGEAVKLTKDECDKNQEFRNNVADFEAFAVGLTMASIFMAFVCLSFYINCC